MHRLKRWLLFINLLGGAAVLGSYAWGLTSRPDAARVLWGGVPLGLRPLYTTCMLIAAAGYFAFTFFILVRLDAQHTHPFGRFDYRAFNVLYAAILFPSALWMPLTLAAVTSHHAAWVWSVRLVLWLAGLGSLGLLLALLSLKAQRRVWAQRAAVIGCAAFCVQTVVLDAVIWSATFAPSSL